MQLLVYSGGCQGTWGGCYGVAPFETARVNSSHHKFRDNFQKQIKLGLNILWRNLTAYNDKTILAFNSSESFCNRKRQKQTNSHIIVRGVSEMGVLAVEKDYFKSAEDGK